MSEIEYSNNQTQVEEISLKELILKTQEWFNYLKSKWVIITFAALCGGIIGFTYAYMHKPAYTATLTFALEDDKPGGMGLSGALGLASSLGIDLGTSAGGAFTGSNLIELMKSRTLVEMALLSPIMVEGKSSSLAEYYIEFSGMRKALNKKENLATIHYSIDDKRGDFSLQKDSILGEVYKNIVGINGDGLFSVGLRDKKLSIIFVDVETEDEFFSKIFAESLVKEVAEFYITTKSKKARTNVAILQRQADSIRNELNNAISGVAQASDNTFNLNPALNIKRVPSSHRQVDVQANTAILTQLVTNLEMAKVTLLKETPLIQIIDKPILPLKKVRVGRIKSFIVGAFLIGFLTGIFLILKKIFQGLMA